MTTLLRRIIAGCVAAALCVSCGVWIAFEISSGSDFNFTGDGLSLKQNQVLFNRTDAAGNKNDNSDNSYSEKKDSDNNTDSSDKGNSGFVFKETAVVNPDENKGPSGDRDDSDGKNNKPSDSGDGKDNVYEIVDDPGKADDVINGDITPSEKPDNSDKPNNGNSGGGSGDGSDKNYSSSAKDPDGQKTNPDDIFTPSDNFKEDVVPATPNEEDGSNESVIIGKPFFSGKTYLYYGQVIDSETVIYNAFETYVQGADGRQYIWDADDYGVYIKVSGFSFDGGKTWSDKYPATIPMSVSDGNMYVRFSYRLSVNAKWVSTVVDYELEETRVLILTEKLKRENQPITDDMLLNPDLYAQHVKLTEKINLLRYQAEFLGNGPLTSLFPGFTEDGKLLPWYYYPTAGRHIVEPADKVPLSPEYSVTLTYRWMSDDFEEGFQYGNLCYLQTLIGYNGNAPGTLSVPMYIQAVDLLSEINVGKVEIPETVLYINTESGNLSVQDEYIVSAENPVYSSQNGLLMNKAKNKIFGIPQKTTEISIPENITAVTLSKNNNLRKIIFEAKDISKLPEINLDNVNSSCNIVVSDEIFDDFISTYSRDIESYGLYIAPASAPDTGYTVKGGVILSRENSLHGILFASNDTLILPVGTASVESGVLQKFPEITKLILPKDGKAVTFTAGSLDGSGIRSIFCYSKEQYDAAVFAADSGVSVTLLAVSKEGYVYFTESDIFEERSVLVSVPSDITEFDGKVTSADGYDVYLTEIQPSAFADNTVLKWVTVPSTVYSIGKNAFSGCSSLEGVLIDNPYSISIGDGAFDGCYSLRFVASNAYVGTLEDGYDFAVTDGYYYSSELYAPTGAWGYSGNWISFTEVSDIVSYTLLDIGENSKALYGVSASGVAKIILRAGKTVDENILLPENTVEIWAYAFADTVSETGAYYIDWSNVSSIALDVGAFQNSMLSGSIVLPAAIYLAEDLFVDCDGITDVTFGYLYPGVTVYSGLFSGSDNFRSVTFTNYDPPELLIDPNASFRFNYMWSEEEETEIVKLCVPQGREEEYLNKWRYAGAGYGRNLTETAYQVMWSDLRYKYSDFETSYFPTDDEVDKLVEDYLVASENSLRKMMNLDPITFPSNFYHYRTAEDGKIIITKASPDITDAMLYPDDVGLIENMYVGYIAKGAFSECKNLEYVALGDDFVGFYEGAFEGVESDSVTLVWLPINPPELLGLTEGKPFDFGVPDDKLMFIEWGNIEDYEEAWLYPLAGYSSEADMRRLVPEELAEELGREPTEEEIEKATEDKLLAAKKRFSLLFDSDDDTEE